MTAGSVPVSLYGLRVKTDDHIEFLGYPTEHPSGYPQHVSHLYSFTRTYLILPLWQGLLLVARMEFLCRNMGWEVLLKSEYVTLKNNWFKRCVKMSYYEQRKLQSKASCWKLQDLIPGRAWPPRSILQFLSPHTNMPCSEPPLSFCRVLCSSRHRSSMVPVNN